MLLKVTPINILVNNMMTLRTEYGFIFISNYQQLLLIRIIQ